MLRGQDVLYVSTWIFFPPSWKTMETSFGPDRCSALDSGWGDGRAAERTKAAVLKTAGARVPPGFESQSPAIPLVLPFAVVKRSSVRLATGTARGIGAAAANSERQGALRCRDGVSRASYRAIAASIPTNRAAASRLEFT